MKAKDVRDFALVIVTLAFTLSPHTFTLDGRAFAQAEHQPVAAQRVFVMGAIKKPGAYTFTSGMTVGNALDLSHGLTANGSAQQLTVRRPTPDGKTVVSKASLDTVLHANDAIVAGFNIF